MASVPLDQGLRQHWKPCWKQIEEEITCSICGDLFTDPKTISCSHTFCKQCIEKSIESNKKMASIACCPLCRAPLPKNIDIASIPTNFTINRLVEIVESQQEVNLPFSSREIRCSNCEDGLPAITWCRECVNYLCKQCNDAHQRMKSFKFHKIVTVEEFFQRPKLALSSSTPEKPEVACKVHSTNLDLYCKTCSCLICQDCILKDHPCKTHNFGFIDEVADEEREKIVKSIVVLKQLLEQVRNGIKKIEDSENEIDIESEIKRKNVQRVYGEVHTLLKEHEEKTLEKVDTVKISMKETLAKQKDTARLIESHLVSCKEFSTDIISTSRTRQLLAYKNLIIDRVEDLTKQVEHASIDPECRADDMIMRCAKPAEFISDSLCDMSGIPHLPHCSVRGPLQKNDPIKVTVTLKDIHGFSVVGQSNNLDIRSNKGKKFLKNVRIEELSSGIYQMQYIPKKEMNHLLSVYWRELVVDRVEVKIVERIRDYVSIKEVKRQVERYGRHNLQVVCPYLIAKGLNNKVIVRNNYTEELIVFDEQLRYMYAMGGTGNGNGRFRNPTGMAVDSNGHLYVGDHTLHCIQKLTLRGKFVSQFGSEGTAIGQFKIPTGLLFSQSELLFVCDKNNHRIQVFKHEKFCRTFGHFGKRPGYFDGPEDLALSDNEDQLFVADCGNDRVQVFTPSGQFLKVFGNFTDVPLKLQNPVGIYYTPDNHLLIASCNNDCVFVFKEDGQFVSAIEGVDDQGKRKFCSPCGVMMLNNGQIVVASVSTHRLLLF